MFLQYKNLISWFILYLLQCKTCEKSYVGQTGRLLAVRHREHIRYIKPTILSHHKRCTFLTSTIMVTQNIHYNCYNHVKKEKLWIAGNLYIYRYCNKNIYKIDEQRNNDFNPLYSLAYTTHTTQFHNRPVDTWQARP